MTGAVLGVCTVFLVVGASFALAPQHVMRRIFVAGDASPNTLQAIRFAGYFIMALAILLFIIQSAQE